MKKASEGKTALVRLPADLVQRVRVLAAKQQRRIGDITSKALRQYLARP
jgi:predicted transcriptional regulator